MTEGEGEKYWIQRVAQLEDSYKVLEKRVLNLELKTVSLNYIDVDSFLRQFLTLKMNIICLGVSEILMERDLAIELPPIPPPSRNLDPLRYYEKKSEKDMLGQAGTDLMGSYAIAKGEIKNADNPLRVAHDWYTKEKKYFEDRNILGVFEETADEKFPITSIEGQN